MRKKIFGLSPPRNSEIKVKIVKYYTDASQTPFRILRVREINNKKSPFLSTFSTWYAKLVVTGRDKQTVLSNYEAIAC